MKKVKRPCHHQTEDSDEKYDPDKFNYQKIPFNYCPWCGKFITTVIDAPKEESKEESDE